MTKEKFMEIVSNHPYTVCTASDIDEAVGFVRALLRAEAEHLKATEPYAVNTIKRLEQADTTICFDLDTDEMTEWMFEEEDA